MRDSRFKNINDAELIKLYQSQEEESVFKEIYYRYKDMIFSYIKRFIYNQPDDIIQDILNEVFIKVSLKISDLKNAYAFKVWIYRIARNMSINYIKSDKFPYVSLDNQDNTVLTDMISDERVNLEKEYMNQEMRNIVMNEIKKLEPLTREIIILKFFNNLTFDEIGDIAKVSVSTVKNKIKSGFVKVNKILKKAGYI